MRQFADPVAEPAGSLLPSKCSWLVASMTRVEEELALDEALLEEAHEGRLPVPVVRTWMATAPTVVVGSSSRIDDEVDRTACDRNHVKILRRPSGGLTVVLGPGCVMWSAVVPVLGPLPPIEQIHSALLDPLAAALRGAGCPVVRRGSSDLALSTADGDRKFSGNALRIRRSGILYHGTLLDAFDLSLIDEVLRHPPREPAYRGRRSHRTFLANLGLGRERIDAAVRDAFGAMESTSFWPQDRTRALARDRYESLEWTERRG